MKIRRPIVPLARLALAVFGIAAAAGVPSCALARPAHGRDVPTRFIISNPNLTDVLPASVQFAGSRFRSGFDAYGGLAATDGPRFVSGSLLKQTFEVYGSSANTALPVSFYTLADLSAGLSPSGLRAFDQPLPVQPTRLKSPRYILDLSRVRPENRMPLLTRILGPERARKAMSQALAAGRP